MRDVLDHKQIVMQTTSTMTIYLGNVNEEMGQSAAR